MVKKTRAECLLQKSEQGFCLDLYVLLQVSLKESQTLFAQNQSVKPYEKEYKHSNIAIRQILISHLIKVPLIVFAKIRDDADGRVGKSAKADDR